jgi:hypothetical protein
MRVIDHLSFIERDGIIKVVSSRRTIPGVAIYGRFGAFAAHTGKFSRSVGNFFRFAGGPPLRYPLPAAKYFMFTPRSLPEHHVGARRHGMEVVVGIDSFTHSWRWQ